jgi:hypothetical protein
MTRASAKKTALSCIGRMMYFTGELLMSIQVPTLVGVVFLFDGVYYEIVQEDKRLGYVKARERKSSIRFPTPDLAGKIWCMTQR